MKTLQASKFKTHFSQILAQVKSGQEVLITYGRKRENIAVLIPYEMYKRRNKIQLGTLSHKKFRIADDFSMTTDQLLGL